MFHLRIVGRQEGGKACWIENKFNMGKSLPLLISVVLDSTTRPCCSWSSRRSFGLRGDPGVGHLLCLIYNTDLIFDGETLLIIINLESCTVAQAVPHAFQSRDPRFSLWSWPNHEHFWGHFRRSNHPSWPENLLISLKGQTGLNYNGSEVGFPYLKLVLRTQIIHWQV